LFYFENPCQAAKILPSLHSTENPDYNSFVPEHEEGTLIIEH
jgi:hypothetical protein